MPIIPDPYEAQELRRLFVDSIIVTVATNALLAFGLDLDVHTAAKLLDTWRYAPELSDRERQAVLARFVPPPSIDDDEWDDLASPVPAAPFFNGSDAELYDREEPTGEPLPDGVTGFPVGGRTRGGAR